MSEENDTVENGGGEHAAPENQEIENQSPPKSDAEAAAQEAAQEVDGKKHEEEGAKEKPKGEDDEQKRKKNRTKAYIDKINRERAELAQRVAELEAKQKAGPGQRPADQKPTLEEHNFDQDAYIEAMAEWKAQELLQKQTEQQKKADQERRQREATETYAQRVAAFADDHPDFPEVVGSIPYPLSNELQAAIMAHESGPEIAYHIGNNDDDAFALASTAPHLAAAAVERLAKRLTAAPKAPNPEPKKPVSQTPAPPPTVSGRKPTDVPPEKMTDDEWFKREQAKRRAK